MVFGNAFTPAYPAAPTARWYALSGRAFDFAVHSPSTSWIDAPAIYIFAKYVGSQWVALYVGEANNLQARLIGHEKWETAVLLGMIGVHVLFHHGTEAERKADESDLIAALNPPLNVRSRMSGLGLGLLG